MKRILSFLLIVAMPALAGQRASAQNIPYAEKVQRYIATYKELAMQEQQRSGIPAAITLAQGILESGAGESELATEAANHFGIKCKSNWTGETYNHDDDAPDECFRKYPSAEASYRDHTDYLKSAGRYAPCFAKSTTDYAAWAFQLKTCGYATSPTYAQRLIRIIEDYKLQQYTYAALESGDPLRTAAIGERVPETDAAVPVTLKESSDIPTASVQLGETPVATTRTTRDGPSRVTAHSETPAEAQARETRATQALSADAAAGDGIVVKDGRRGFYAKKGDVLLEDAIRHRIRYAKLLEINGLPDEPLSADRFVFLEKASTIRFAANVAAAAGRDETAHVASENRPRPMSADVAIAEPPAVVAMASTPAPVQASEAAPQALDEAIQATREEPQEPSQLQEKAASSINVIATAEQQPIASTTREEAPTMMASANEAAGIVSATPAPGMVPDPVASTTTENPTAPAAVVVETPIPVSAGSEATENTEKTTAANPAVEDGFNIASEEAVEEAKPVAAAAPEPQDEMSRLKARFDKAVYSPVKPVAKPAQAVASTSAPDKVVVEKPAPIVASSAAGAKYYTVQKGDTAFGIAKKHGITVRQLQDWNGLSMDAGVPLGKKLKVQP